MEWRLDVAVPQDFAVQPSVLRRAEDFCRTHLPVSAWLDPSSMSRRDEPEIPILALREALADAVSHREYSTAAGSISVFVYDDRVEVASVGGLHFGLSVDDLLRSHESQPWNPLIAGALYRRGVVDSLAVAWTSLWLEMAVIAAIFDHAGVHAARRGPPDPGALPRRPLMEREPTGYFLRSLTLF